MADCAMQLLMRKDAAVEAVQSTSSMRVCLRSKAEAIQPLVSRVCFRKVDIDFACMQDTKGIRDYQLAFMEMALNSSTATWNVVVAHHPFYGTADSYGVEDKEGFSAVSVCYSMIAERCCDWECRSP